MIPWLLIVGGGIAIYSGIKGKNPIDVIKETIGGINNA